MTRGYDVRMRGFSMIELAIVIFIAGLFFAGLMNILQAAITSRQNAILNEAIETTKTTAILTAFNSRSFSGSCYIGLCSPTGPCGGLTPCYVSMSSYTIPATIAVQKDNWGNDLTYTQLVATVTGATVPATNVFRVTSRGPDATAGTADDVTFTVNAAEFIARVSRMGL